MAKQTINIGASPNDGTGTPLRTSFDYTNQNFTEIYTALGGGVALPGATTQVIFNDGGTNLAGDAGLVYNKTTDALTVAGLVTAGSATITGDLTVDTSTLKVDSTNNRVGIGTASPNGPLDVQANSAATAISIRGRVSANVGTLRWFQNNGTTETAALESYDTGFEIRTLTNVPQIFLINGTEQMRLNSTGLGIGVSPTSKLSLLDASPRINFVTSAGLDITGYIYNAIDVGSGGKLVFGTKRNGDTALDFMTLDASGNLLVASGVVRAAGRTQIGSGYVGDISGTGNNRGIFLGSTGILPSDGSGNISDNTYDLGSGSSRWDTVFAGTGTINTSDRNEKQDISDLSASEKRVASSIKQLVKKYRFNDAVVSKGENARIHVGWIAQDIQSAFAAEGLDASKYGVFCSDTWYEVNGSSVDSDKKPYTTESENAVAKTRLGLRHDELLAFVVSNL
jgi:hypothetical protein